MKYQDMVKRWMASILIQSYVRRRIARSIVGTGQKDIIVLQSGKLHFIMSSLTESKFMTKDI
jgi:predicted mannosyl-3-phosphoglycerate phosphatase (HAD superfamily)